MAGSRPFLARYAFFPQANPAAEERMTARSIGNSPSAMPPNGSVCITFERRAGRTFNVENGALRMRMRQRLTLRVRSQAEIHETVYCRSHVAKVSRSCAARPLSGGVDSERQPFLPFSSTAPAATGSMDYTAKGPLKGRGCCDGTAERSTISNWRTNSTQRFGIVRLGCVNSSSCSMDKMGLPKK